MGKPAGRRTTFDRAAESYDRARPEYPAALFDDLVRHTGVATGDRVLEIGCGSGKATRRLADRGLRVTCVELGPNLAARALAALAEYPDVEVVHSSFEAWHPPDAEPFDLAVAATSWHWIDLDVRYRKTFDLLRPGGHLAFWSAAHVFPEGGDPFFRELQDVYDEIGEGLLGGAVWPRPGELPDRRDEIEATGLYDVVSVEEYDWEVVYDAEGYLELLDTFSGHIAMAPWQRERLYGEIRRRLGERPDGLLRRGWGAVLHVARRRNPSDPAGVSGV